MSEQKKSAEDTMFEIREPHRDNSAWVLSYCDLICQLIAFFLMLFAMSTVQNQQWQQVRSSFAQRLDPNKDVKNNEPAAELSVDRKDVLAAQDLGYLQNILKDKLEGALKGQVVVQHKDGRLVISIEGDESFVKGSTHMTPHLESTLLLISDVLRTITNRVEVNGNADPTPVSGKTFPSNWELSLARALAVGDYFHEHGYAYRLSVYGRGDSAYNEIPREVTADQRERLSRRIDIIIRADRAEPR